MKKCYLINLSIQDFYQLLYKRCYIVAYFTSKEQLPFQVGDFLVVNKLANGDVDSKLDRLLAKLTDDYTLIVTDSYNKENNQGEMIYHYQIRVTDRSKRFDSDNLLHISTKILIKDLAFGEII